MPGPLPNPARRRTNAPTIPTTNLPASGRQGPAPKPPRWASLGAAARQWWVWAWATPQACGWSEGDLAALARRASFEDYLAEAETVAERSPVLREMRELDDRLGLTPKGLAQLRWKIVDDSPAETVTAGNEVPNLDDRRRRLASA